MRSFRQIRQVMSAMSQNETTQMRAMTYLLPFFCADLRGVALLVADGFLAVGFEEYFAFAGLFALACIGAAGGCLPKTVRTATVAVFFPPRTSETALTRVLFFLLLSAFMVILFLFP